LKLYILSKPPTKFPGKDAWRKVNWTWEKFLAKEFFALAGVWA
jgi:hypothetical protein